MSIRICIPHTGSLDAGLVEWLLQNNHPTLFQKSYSVVKARNVLMQRFLYECSDNWLMFLDSDMWPAGEGLFDFVESQKEDLLFTPGLTNFLEWNFAVEDKFTPLRSYCPTGEYQLQSISFFGGSGIFMRRRLVEKLPHSFWRESTNNSTTAGEDVLFSSTLTGALKIPAFLIQGSALHHSKNGFDLLSVLNA